jgi:hypothetical protein
MHSLTLTVALTKYLLDQVIPKFGLAARPGLEILGIEI